MRNIKLIIAYNGAPFYGWQHTKVGPSIEGAIKEFLERMLKHPIRLQAASRTDRGVHAHGQVVNFETVHPMPLSTIQKALNAQLPREIRVLQIQDMPKTFHPTLDCIQKEYHYSCTFASTQTPFERHTHWHVYPSVLFSKMEEALVLFVGKKDFSALRNWRPDAPECTICHLKEFSFEKGRFRLIGDRFLYKMVRNLVGSVVDIGMGKLSLEKVRLALAEKNRSLLGVTAPAHGLALHRVYYEAEKDD